MSPITQSQSQDVPTFRQQGFNACCLMAGSGSLFCTYIGFASVDGHVRSLFRVSSVGFFTFTVIGYSYGYESTSIVKKAAFHLALVFSSGGLGLCGAYWMEAVPKLLLLILSILTCLFQAVCVSFQLEGSGLLLHTLLTALLPALASVGPGAASDMINYSLGAVLEQEARILQAGDDDSGESWAYKIIIAAVCVVVGTVFLAVCKVWHRRHTWLRREAGRVVEWHDVALGRTMEQRHSSSLEESMSNAANSMEVVPDDGSRALHSDISIPGRLDSNDPGSNGNEQAEIRTTTSLLHSREPLVLEDRVDDVPISGEQSQSYHSENTSASGVTDACTNMSVGCTDPGDLIMVGVTTLSGVSVFQRHLLPERTVFELKDMVVQTSFWPNDLHTSHMDIMLNNNTLLLNSATLRDVAHASKVTCTVIVKPVVYIRCSMSAFGLTSLGEEMSVVTSSEDRGAFVVSRNNEGSSVRISLQSGRSLVQDRVGRIRLLPALEPGLLERAIESERLQLGADWRLEGYLREDNFEVRIRNVRYGTLMVEKRAPRSPEHPHEHAVKADAGAGDSAAARWIFT